MSLPRTAALLLASLITTFTAIPEAFADVNMMEASFQTDFTDLQIGGLKITRRYSSRSNFTGAFGFGWCSTFDAHLEFSETPAGKFPARLKECGRTTTLDSGTQKVRQNGNTYTQHLATGLVRTFSSETGELVSLQTETGPEVRILRGAGSARSRLPRDAALEEGLKMRLEYDALNETIVSLETSTGKRLEFTYSASRDLLSARNAWSNSYHFSYDSLHNLVRIDYPDHTSEKMTYDPDRDRLLSFEGRTGRCKETYSHAFETTAKELKQKSNSRLVCGGRLKRQVEFNFTYAKRENLWALSALSVTRSPSSNSGDAQ